jgi:hypothetical protein
MHVPSATYAAKMRILSKADESSPGPSLTVPEVLFFLQLLPKHGQRSVRCPVRVWASRHEREHLGTSRILRGWSAALAMEA